MLWDIFLNNVIFLFGCFNNKNCGVLCVWLIYFDKILLIFFYFWFICRNLMVYKIIVDDDVLGCIFFLCVSIGNGNIRVLFFDNIRISLLV